MTSLVLLSTFLCQAKRTNVLEMGESLEQGQSLWSLNGRNRLIMQADGNLAGYVGPLVYAPAMFWQSGTSGKGGLKATMQTDGDFVISDKGGTVIWKSQTHGRGVRIVIMDDMSVCVLDKNARVVWSSDKGTLRAPPAPQAPNPSPAPPAPQAFWGFPKMGLKGFRGYRV